MAVAAAKLHKAELPKQAFEGDITKDHNGELKIFHRNTWKSLDAVMTVVTQTGIEAQLPRDHCAFSRRGMRTVREG